MSYLKPRNLLLLVVVGAAVTMVFSIWQQKTTDPPQVPPTETVSETDADATMQSVDYTQTKEGRRLWRFNADSAEYLRDQNRTRAEEIVMTFFDEGEEVRYTLNAAQGEMTDNGEHVKVWGGVVIVGRDQQRLETERLTYSGAENRVTTDAPVKIFAPGRILSGVGMVYNLSSGRLQIRSQARARLTRGF